MLAHPLLQVPMALLIILRMIPRRQPTRLSIRDLANRTGHRSRDLLLLPLDSADLEARIARGEEHLVPVETEERLGGVFTRDFGVEQHGEPPWV